MKRLREFILRLRPRRKRGFSNIGKWRRSYADLDRTRLYGDRTTYELAAEFLADVEEVEDWGCGAGGFRRFCRTKYVGVDGTVNPYVDRVGDLATYTSDVGGILLRHVLEHNQEWEKILDNAVSSFRQKLCIVLFTPFAERTTEIRSYWKKDIVDIAFRKDDLIKHFNQHLWRLEENLKTDTQYKVEHVFYIEKSSLENERPSTTLAPELGKFLV